ncbi:MULTISPECIES: hypothetical protein [Yersinia pseudotuberculosis complex]|uniref:hypothetical protein n=1 Tax=Yersinia pseudotuberculosis complex TaxID=1649845 RepID=UPI0005B42AAF|nr:MULTISPECIES: hypothetical protein [Yersinia pseudotuberculosis complex]BET62897.1 hypothetical protein YPSE1_23560 [Yersinia pseudotuberculosis]CNB09079.1 Uncharacterised protein [Yersinia similis]CNF45136.1 Uncharacterised protein [Yersinia similis]
MIVFEEVNVLFLDNSDFQAADISLDLETLNDNAQRSLMVTDIVIHDGKVVKNRLGEVNHYTAQQPKPIT